MLQWLTLVCLGLMVGATLASLARRRVTHPTRGMSDELAMELERARRYGRTFQLAMVTLAPVRAGSETVSVPPSVGVRRTDRAWQLESDIYVLLPETDDASAARWVQRLHRESSEDLEVRTASFPDDGLTLDALLDHLGAQQAGSEIRTRPAPQISTEPAIETRAQVAS